MFSWDHKWQRFRGLSEAGYDCPGILSREDFGYETGSVCNLGQKTKENFVWALPVLSTACLACELHFHVYKMKSFLCIWVKRNIGENTGILFCCRRVCSTQNIVRRDNEHLCSSTTPDLSSMKVGGFERLFEAEHSLPLILFWSVFR